MEKNHRKSDPKHEIRQTVNAIVDVSECLLLLSPQQALYFMLFSRVGGGNTVTEGVWPCSVCHKGVENNYLV